MTGRSPGPRRPLAPGRWVVLLTVLAVFAAVLVPFDQERAEAAVPAEQLTATVASAASIADAVDTAVRPASLAGWRAGNIISDAVLQDSSTMTAAQIDAFFRGKVSACQPGYTCLKDFRMSTVNRPADSYCKGYSGAPNESAATIIYRVAQSCGINPQVFIVMLQKEQGLITHTWPSQWRYDAALGQGCPDDAPCDPSFVGFFHQIYGAGRQMKIYMEGVYFQWYAPGNTWNILYNPNQSCGSGPVYIENAATAALYYYTPYQPNAAALAAGYGEGDRCSAYGNRNFYNYFTDWFGSTREPGSTGPGLSSLNASSFVTAIDTNGVLWGYPFQTRVWGERKQLAIGLAGAKMVAMPGDLDGDGNRDLLVRRGSDVLAMYGTGSGFTNATTLDVDWGDAVLATAAGDLDGDGVPDILSTNAAGDLMLARGDDHGGFLPSIRVGWGWGGMNQLVGDIDLNRDGNPDIIGRDTSGRLWAYYGDGRGGWSGQAQIGQGWGGMTDIFVPGDFTGDGVKDLAARTAKGDLLLYPGNSVGGLFGGGPIGMGWQIMSAVSGAGVAVTGPRALPAGAGDVDGDGGPDVLAVSTSGAFSIYRGNGVGAWRGSTIAGSGWGANDRMLTMGDFDGDGYRDLGRTTPGGDFYLYPGRATGFANGVKIGNGWQTLSLLVTGADFDGDRNPDVIGRDSTGRLVMYRGDGAGGWASSATAIGYGWGGFDLAFHAGDFDGDGNSDLILRSTDKNLWLYPTNGAGGWGTPRQIGYAWGGFTAIFSPGDFDGDGNNDVIGRSASGDLYLFSGDGNGGWKSSRVIGNGWGGFTQLG